MNGVTWNPFRPTDDPPLLCINKIFKHTGWKPRHALEQTLKDVLDDAAKP